MTDGDLSTIPSGVTRRALLSGTATVALAPILHDRSTHTAADPIAALYRDWRKADAEVSRWCREWGKLESALVRSVGFPRVAVSLPPSTAAIWVTTHEDIDRVFADRSDLEALRGSLHAELTTRNARWNAEATAIGLDEADRQQALAFDRRETLAFRAFALPAGDLACVVTKLTLVLRMGQTRDSDETFPWAQIQSITNDLRRLVTNMHA
jgi:hypothetical protein